jgi:hypothetical protein
MQQFFLKMGKQSNAILNGIDGEIYRSIPKRVWQKQAIFSISATNKNREIFLWA